MATPPRAAEVLPTAGRRCAHRDERQRYAQGPLELEPANARKALGCSAGSCVIVICDVWAVELWASDPHMPVAGGC